MKLHWSPRSPFVRKVMIVAHEMGLVDRLTLVRTVAASDQPHPELMRDNPLSKIPTLVLDDGTVLYDSPVICEYLDRLHAGPKLFPPGGAERMTALRRQALGDGLLDFLLLWRDERARPQPSDVHLASFAAKRKAALAAIDTRGRRSRGHGFFHRTYRAWLRARLSGFPVCGRRLARRSSAACALARGFLRPPVGPRH